MSIRTYKYGHATYCDRCGRQREIFRTDGWTIDVVTGQRRTEWLCAECKARDERKARW